MPPATAVANNYSKKGLRFISVCDMVCAERAIHNETKNLY